MHRTVGIVLVYLNCHSYISRLWWFSLFLADSHLVVISLFVCNWSLVDAGYYYYHWLYDDQRWPCTKVKEAGGLILASLLLQANILTCISCIWIVRALRILVTPHMSLPIIIITVSNLTLYNDIKSITFNG